MAPDVIALGRCHRCCEPMDKCRCITTKGPHLCYRCCEPFKIGDQYQSDAPGIVYHLPCYIADVKESK